LFPIQKKAAEWGEGPLLVLAGPGSGKTKALTCRIARMLESSRDKNFRILGLTFTNKAADEMRNRVTNFVPEQEGRLFFGTFHSFCADVLRQHGTHLGINPNFHIYSQDVDLQAVLNDAVENAKKVTDVVSDLDKKTLPVIQRLKSLLVFPEQCREVFKDKEFRERMAAVYPVGLVEDELPSFQSKKKGDKSLELEEERRNCFVAITRTIKTLTLSYAERYKGWSKKPSRFLFEMELLND